MNRIRRLWSRLRRITKINLILGTVFTLVAAYVGLTAYFGTASQVRYASNDFPGAKKAATAFLRLSPLQRHIGYFNRGTAEAAVGDYDEAQADLEAALEIAPTSAECAVRINLSFVYEKQADEISSQDPDQSQELYDRSLKTLDEAPEECQPKKSEEKQKSEKAKDRVEDKKKGEQAKDDGTDDSDSSGDSQDEDSKDQESDDRSSDGDGKKSEEENSDQSDDSKASEGRSEREKKREELEKRAEDSDRQQQQQGPGGNGGRSSPDKPW